MPGYVSKEGLSFWFNTNQVWKKIPSISVYFIRYKFVSKMFSDLKNVLGRCADAFGTRIVQQECKMLHS